MDSFSLGSLFKEILAVFKHPGPRVQACGALCLHVDSDSAPWPTYAHLRGQEGFGWGFPRAHLRFVYTGGRDSHQKVFCSEH